MQVILAPNAFKGSLTAEQAAAAMARGIEQALPQARLTVIPVADGGDGLLQVLQSALADNMIRQQVTGPLGDPVQAEFMYCSAVRLAVIEIATATGLNLLSPDQYNPLLTSTAGVGELILAAAELGARRIILGLGGSATNDAGMGMARALGVRFNDAYGNPLPGNGAQLTQVRSLDMRGFAAELRHIEFHTICDVNNPLLGAQGATRVFAPQKGADDRMLDELESGMQNFSQVVDKELNTDLGQLAGGGAAGGLTAGSFAFLNANLHPGAELVLDLLEFDKKLKSADLVITGEGRLDNQTRHGKAPAEVARRAHRHNIPCIAMAGSLQGRLAELHTVGMTAAFSICSGPVSLAQAMENAAEYLTQTTAQAMLGFVAGKTSSRSY